MAEFAVGLTKTAVEGMLSRVKSAIEEETQLRVRVQDDLVFITGEFEMMQSFLNVANKDRAKNEVVQTWVRQVRTLAFDVEDCVEFVVHLDTRSAWTWLWRVMPSCMAPSRPLDQAAAEIKQLKARVEDVSQRNTRYNLISDSGSNSKGDSLVEEPTAGGPSAFHNLRGVWEAAGKRRDIVDLQELIARECSDLQVISLWGSTGGDLGTTSILRNAYCDPETCQQFKSRAWVKLMHPFNSEDFLKSLLTQFDTSSHQANEGAGHLKMAELKQKLNDQRYLIILEELSTVVQWDAIRMCLPDSKNSSRIVVSTEQLGIALLCTGEPNLVAELRPFSDGQSLCAFFKKVSGGRSDMGELKWQVSRGGVFSVWGSGQRKSAMVRKLFRSIVQKKEEFDGLAFQTYRWVHVVDPFDLMDFSRRLFLDLSTYDLEFDHYANGDITDCQFIEGVNEDDIEAFFNMEEEDLIEGCLKLLREADCLVAINGLQFEDWEIIKEKFLSDTIKGCIIVITQEEDVAEYCVESEQDRILSIDDLQADAAEGCVFSSGREEASELIKKFELVGHGDEGNSLTKLIIEDNPGVVSAWGIAGVGKSALIRFTYCHLMLGLGPYFETAHSTASDYFDKEFFEKFSWVDVPHPFNLTRFSQRLLLDFHSDDLQAQEAVAVRMMEGRDPIQDCCRLLRDHACLIVADGLRSTRDWDLIKATFLPVSTTSCIVVITNEAGVSKHCVNNKNEKMVNIKGLELDEALNLFKQIPRDWEPEQTRDVIDLSKHILAKCGGIPKVISAIGKYSSEDISSLKSIHDDFMGKLEMDPLFDSLKGLFSWMHSYFDACSDSLKPCIFYLSVFLVGYKIRRKRLLRRWIAEGYSRDRSGSTAEENGEMLFDELVDFSIIQLQQPSRKVLCQVNGFFREYIISRPMEDNFVFALEGRCTLNSQRTGQHLTIRSNWDRDKILFESTDFSRLRSFTVFGEWRPFFISTNVDMGLLRVLDLEDTSGVTDYDFEKIGKFLPRLKFLSVRGCKGISCVPNSFGLLRQLQTLDVKETSIVTLPSIIMKLEKLQYIRAGITIPAHGDWTSAPDKNIILNLHPKPGGVKISAGIGKLTALHTLGVVNVSGAGGKAILKELKTLTQLHRLRVSGINTGNIEDLCSVISGHGHLESLSIQIDKDNNGIFPCLDGISEPPKTLKSLKLYGHVHKVPISWIKQLDHLEKLELEMTIQTQEDLYVLDELPRRDSLRRRDMLRRLCIKPTVQDGQLRFERRQQFPIRLEDTVNLRVLKIDCSSSLEIIFEDWITMSVVLLIIDCSPGSCLRISGLQSLYLLKEVCLKGSYEDTLKQNLQDQIDGWPRYRRGKPVLKLEQPPSS